MSERIRDVLLEMRDSLGNEGEVQDLGADNQCIALTVLERYFADVLRSVCGESDQPKEDPAEVLGFVFFYADYLADRGYLPYLPLPTANETALVTWIGKAQQIGFTGK